MQNLLNPAEYTDALRNLIAQSRLGIELANPGRVTTLIEAQEYQAAFEMQLEQEIEAEANAAQYNHLSSWEKTEALGLSESPP
ncbi:MAG: hypothetical protein Q8K61_10570 [Gallionella sp.]|nr:hypothetical protein [Gallionella sp.]